MVELTKLNVKRMYQTSDGEKFETLEEAQYHSRILKFREMIGVIKSQLPTS